MDHPANDATRKPATAARIYDYYLGGIHNFPADQQAARTLITQFPCIPAVVRANRAFLRRAVGYLVDAGIRQFLDLGSGIPTEGNVHEIAAEKAPGTRVVYVDIDPMAVAESQELLAGNDSATAIRGDLRKPEDILSHPETRRLLDLRQPIAVLLVSVLHFVPDDTEAYGAVEQFAAALPAGGYVVVSHAASEAFDPMYEVSDKVDVYRQQTPTPGTSRTRPEVERFLTGLDLVEPGVVRLAEWRPDRDVAAQLADDPHGGAYGSWAGIGRKG